METLEPEKQEPTDEHLAKNRIADGEAVFEGEQKPIEQRANTPGGAASPLGRAQDTSPTPPST